MPNALAGIVRIRGWPLSRSFEQAIRDVRTTQESLLLKWIRQCRDTAFGRDHHFPSIRNIGDFRKNIPIRDFEGIRPYVDRAMSGERGVLTAEDPLMYALTSGTTSQPKYIPVTYSSDRLGSSLMHHWVYRLLIDHPAAYDHRQLGVVSPAIEGVTPTGVPYGSVSGRIYQSVPWVIRRNYSIPYWVSEIADYDLRYFVSLRFAIAGEVSFAGSPNPSTLIRLAEVGRRLPYDLIRAIHDGKLGVDLPGQEIISAQLSQTLKPDPKRAKTLETSLENFGELLPRHYWPHLRVIGCWTGGTVGALVPKLRALYGDSIAIRDLGYLASEARMSLPIHDGTSSGVLAIQNNYFEFIPEEEADSDTPIVLGAHELEQGKKYAVIITTAAGLYRYDIHDIIEVTGFMKQAPLIAFIRKGSDMANITGEKLHVNHCLAAMNQLRNEHTIEIQQFRFAANAGASQYEVYLELAPGQSSLSPKLTDDIDRSLQNANLEYAQKRASGRLNPPRIRLMRRGWAESELRRWVESGKRDVQFKWKYLLNEVSSHDEAWVDSERQ